MTLAAAATLWISSFATVFLLGFQSRNVQAGRYAWASATSFAISAAQLMFVRIAAADSDPVMVLAVSGSAGPAGICSAMWLTRHLIRKPPGHS